MSGIGTTAEELFRFAGTRAPQSSTQVVGLNCPEAIAVKANAAPLTASDTAKRIDNLIRRWKLLTGTPPSVLFAQLFNGKLKPDDVPTVVAADSPVVLLEDAWKAVMPGLTGSATNSQLEELRKLVAIGTLLSKQKPDLKALAPSQINSLLTSPLEMPAIVVNTISEERSRVANEAGKVQTAEARAEARKYEKVVKLLTDLFNVSAWPSHLAPCR